MFMIAPKEKQCLDDIELHLLLEGIYRQYGFDFRKYAPSSLKRRVFHFMNREGIATISGLQDKILHDGEAIFRFMYSLSVNVSAMFRDPGFFLAFRQQVVPLLKTYPFIRIWLAGVSMGEEVYSMAILLKEEGIYERCRIYATDINEEVLKKGRLGIYSLDTMQEYTANYLRAGGTQEFSQYYTAAYQGAIFNASLRENVLFAHHNLATDSSFNEFNVILCRNVMIYFNTELQGEVHRLLYQSLSTFGILALGSKETLRFSPFESSYEELDRQAKLYKRIA
jgi:chemotaxis protein methyltransferase CheR